MEVAAMKLLQALRDYFTGSQRFRLLLLTLVLLVVADGVISQFLLTNRFGLEGNPLLRRWVGEDSFLLVKSLGALIAALILWDVYKRFPRVAFIATTGFVVLYTAVVYWNLSVALLNQ